MTSTPMSNIQLDFEAWLAIAALVTGIFWALEKWRWAPRRADGDKANWAVDFAHSFFPVLLAVLILRAFVIEPFRIPSRSMVPTLLVGDFILVNKFGYGLRLPVTHTKIFDIGEPERGDVMVFRYPDDPTKDYIKRVIGLPGDTVAYRGNQLYVNGKQVPAEAAGLYTGEGAPADFMTELLYEDLPGGTVHPILDVMGRPGPQQRSIKVPPHHYFVMGDNRDNSADSRVWGFVPESNLVGQAFMIWLSIDFNHFGIRWSRIGSIID